MKRKTTKLFFISILSVILLAGGWLDFKNISDLVPGTAKAASLTYSAAANLNLRSGPSTKYRILGTIKKGSGLTVTSTGTKGWYQVKYNGKIGYVSSQYVKASGTSSTAATTTQANLHYYAITNLNVRSGASTAYPKIGVINTGAAVSVQAKTSNGWYQIAFNEKKGYVSSAYVKQGTPAPSYVMNVPVVLQKPQLPAGCEVTSLTMALQYKGIKVDKLTLAKKMPYTHTLDPNKGYVGSPYNNSGYTINPVKLQELAKAYRPQSANLTGASTGTIEKEVRAGNPVLVWYTIGYVDVRNLNHYKYQNGHKYWWPQPLHCIVVTGASNTSFYINDPLNGNKNHAITKARFAKIYIDMGKRALVVR